MQSKIYSAIIALLLILNTFYSYAQIDILLPPTIAEKKEIKKAIAELNDYFFLQLDTFKTNDKKALQGKFIRTRLSNSDVFVYNDIDSNAGKDNFIPFIKYSKKLSDTSAGKLSMNIDTAKIYVDKIRYDKIRRIFFAEAKALKDFTWKEIKPRVSDTIAVKDSTKKDTINQSDTITNTIQKKVTLIIKFERENNVSKNFKFIAFTIAGIPAKLEPLPALVTWWLQLDPDWKSFCQTKMKMEEYPREMDIEKLTGTTELDLSNAAIKHLNPLKNFNNLRKLYCSNTVIKSIEPLAGLKNLKVLSISKTKIDTLAGIEKIPSLEELYCAGNFLESIAEVGSLKNLVKLDCSENMLRDVEAVKDLVNLRDLNFSLNIKIKNVDPIKNLDSLEKLSMRKIDLRNLENLRQLKNLVYLDLFNTNIDNLEPIKNLPKITYLDLSHNKMPNLDAIKNYRFITELLLSSSSINDLSTIKNYEYLRVLDISNTLISDLGPVHKLEDIKVLKAFYTKIGKDEIQRFKKNHPRCQITYY